jgi:4-aminobutyrate aminotransferase/(S)-3-amino-2-methylpropionate transaminase
MPLSAVTGRAEIMDQIHPGGLGGTYTGNPVACAAAIAAMEWMVTQDANQMAKDIEKTVKSVLNKLASKHPEIAEVRGMGAMVAIEFLSTSDRKPMAAEVSKIAASCHKAGVVVLTSGMHGNVIRFLPPLSIPTEILASGLEIFAEKVTEVLGN